MKTSNYSAYLRYMDANGIKYTAIDDRAVRVQYNGHQMPTVAVVVIFDDNNDGRTVQFVVYSIAKVAENKLANALVACNALNDRFRWVKLYVDKDSDFRVEGDAIVNVDTVGEECSEMVQRIVSIVDQAYPEIMKVVWG